MSEALWELEHTTVLVRDGGVPVDSEQDALDLIGHGSFRGASWVAVATECLPDEFFWLSTGMAGGIAGKFANYRMGLAIIGDISRYTSTSTAFEDLVRESNRGTQLWFLPDLDALRTRLELQ